MPMILADTEEVYWHLSILVALKVFEGFFAGIAAVEGFAGGGGELRGKLCIV